jgi:hypothetical protein
VSTNCLQLEKAKTDSSTVIISTSVGSIFLALILASYIHVRHKVASNEKAATKVEFSFRLEPHDPSSAAPASRSHPAVESMRSVTYDRWLIARFLTSFAASNVMQSTVIIYYILLYRRNGMLVKQDGPDYSMKTNIADLAITMPSVSSGLLIFIVFGTTAPYRRVYKSWITCRSCRKGKSRSQEDPGLGSASRGGRDNHWVNDTSDEVGSDDLDPAFSSLEADADEVVSNRYIHSSIEGPSSERT